MSFLLSGNEAIAQGAFEAGVTIATGYPGTPSTEILENVVKFKSDIYCEWSPNEKVAFPQLSSRVSTESVPLIFICSGRYLQSMAV